jgi:hypothetical protein
MAEPRTTREALVAEILGELDSLLARVERLPKAITEAENRLLDTARILDNAGNTYRVVVTAFTEEAKLSLTAYLQHKASQLGSLTKDEQRVLIQEAVALALSTSIGPDTTRPNSRHPVLRPSEPITRVERLLEHAVTAVLASVLTVALLFLTVDLAWR